MDRWSDVVVVITAGLIVNVAFSHRSDWAAHLVSGGTAVMAAAALAPSRWRRWSGPVAAAAVLVVAVAAELTIVGPWDASDVAFTAAGAVLVAGERAPSDRPRRQVLVVAVGLLLAAVYFRYGVRRGP